MYRNRLIKLRKNYFIVTILLLVITGVFLYVLFFLSKSRSFQFFGEIIPRVETDKKIVALTFDDAPTPYSDEVLAILADKNVAVTFYVIGQNMEKYPEQGKNIVQFGHELGNHSYSHQRFLLKPLSFIETEIEETNQLIREAGYEGEITFRPPYGKKLFALPWYLSEHNVKTIMVDVEAETYMPKLETDGEKKEFLVQHTLEKTQPGSIILLHPFCESCGASRQAIGPIIDGLRAKGYEFVTVAKLLQHK
ncbi:MAG: polysaccharide deacetylase family protein [Microgenomates group bacterium]